MKTQIGHNKAKSAHACKPNSSTFKEGQALKKTLFTMRLFSQDTQGKEEKKMLRTSQN